MVKRHTIWQRVNELQGRIGVFDAAQSAEKQATAAMAAFCSTSPTLITFAREHAKE